MVKLGELYLNDGIWQSQQLVPAAWVKDATAPIPQSAASGRMWWIVDVGEHHGCAAQGRAGQLILVSPGLHAVVAVSSRLDDDVEL